MNYSYKLKVASIIMIVISLLCGSFSNKVYASTYSIDETITDRYIEECMQKGNLSGLAVVVVKDDQIIYQKNFGYADLETKAKITNNTHFEIASNSKAFTALAILNLCKEGKISLSDKISNYLPQLKFTYNGTIEDITIQECLEHRTGIPFSSIQKVSLSQHSDNLLDAVQSLSGMKLNFIPNEQFEYVSANYDILGAIIQVVSGVPYETYVTENVLNILNLNETVMYQED
jgi:putative pyoverdin transport system ATP-binding/permease protein